MHIALLLGYGASAINPYLAFESVADLALRNRLSKDVGVAKAVESYIKALCKGLLKTMSKMGISTLRSYRSAQVFEAVGLNHDVVDRYFGGTASRIEGIGLDEIAAEARARYQAANEDECAAPTILPSGGHYSYRKDGERHLWSPEAIDYLQRASRTNDYGLYRQYAALINDQERAQSTLRGLLRFKTVTPVPLDEVEPESEIVKRFVSGAMSFGSISQEAHETLAIAMNRLGGMSNSGEGGEDPERYMPAAERRQQVQRHQADRERPVRRHRRVPGQRPRPADQDRPGRQARRGRAASGRQGLPVDRQDAALHPVCEPDLAAAAPRHLLHRGHQAAHLRPALRQSRGAGVGEAGVGGGRGHRGRGRGRRPRPTWCSSAAMTAARAPLPSPRCVMPARPGSSAWPRPSRRWC